MSENYIPLYRKYRPQTFYDLIGQEHVTKALSNAVDLGRISHAYLFCGPRGTGKTSSARILAKSLNCKEGPTLRPCGVCPSCVDITNTTPLDVIEIDAASNRGVEDTQKIIEKIQYAPVHGKYKIYVIDEVHQLSSHSFNALLKTLEEPPENVIFILATTEPNKVLDTVISRCQRFDFKRITVADIVKRLRFIADEEKIKITDDALYAIAKNSAGGMRDSLSLLDQVSILDVEKEVTVDDIEKLLGKISNDVLYNIFDLILSQNTPECLNLINEIYSKGNEPTQIISNLIQYLRNLLILRTITNNESVKNLTQLSDDYIEKMSEQAKKTNANQLVFIIEKLADYTKEIKSAPNPYMWLELCFIDLSSTNFESYEKLLERIEKLEAGVVAAPPKQAVQAPSKPIAPQVQTTVYEPKVVQQERREEVRPVSKPQPQSTGDTSSSAWSEILSNIEHTPSKVLFSSKGIPIELTPEKAVIAFLNEIFVKQAKDTTKFNAIKNALLNYFNVKDINLEIRLKHDGEQACENKIEEKKTLKVETPPSNEISPEENQDAEYYDTMLSNQDKEIEHEKTEEAKPKYDNTSDQANLVIELFNGKIIE